MLLLQELNICNPTLYRWKKGLSYSCLDMFQIPCFLLEKCVAPDCFAFTSFGVFLQVKTLM